MALSINGEIVPQDRIRHEADSMRGQYYQAMQSQDHEMTPEQLEAQLQDWAAENVIEEVILRQEASRRIAEVSEDEIEAALQRVSMQYGGAEALAAFKAEAPCRYRAMRESIVTELKVDKLREELTRRAAAPKSSEIAEYYVKHKDEFSTPELVHAMHIVKHTGEHAGPMASEGQALSAITEVKKELDDGRAFEEVANEHSDCGGNGGDLGWFPRGQMVESFEDVVFGLEPGQVSGIFKTEFGYHIAKLIERRPESVRPLNEVRDEISEKLLEQKKAKMIENFLDQQRERAKIETIEEPAPEPQTETPAQA